MAEEGRESSRVAAVFIALISLFTLAAIYAPRLWQPAAAVAPRAAARPVASVVEVWVSTADHRLQLTPQPDLALAAADASPADITIERDTRYQSMTGFGAALTDSSAWLLRSKLSARQRDALLRELYGPPPNLNFNMTRLTIGASDFSLNLYTLDDVPFGQTDPELKHFSVAPNLAYLIPTMRQIMAIHPGMLVVASSWSAPPWMKDGGNLIGGTLLESYEGVYADYLVKYVDAYARHGIPIAALTLQNEPRYSPLSYPGMQLSAEQRARIIGEHLGPKLATRVPKVAILDWDHNWSHPEEPLRVLGDPKAAPFVDGVAWHCYEGSQHEQGRVHREHPDKDTYITECSGGDWPLNMNGELLWFSRNLLVTGTRQWARGVIYWNLALDEDHGPHFGGCAACKGVVTIDSTTGAITRNDEYYALGHFSRFVLPGAFRVKSNDTDATKDLANVAFQNDDGSMVLVIVNIATKPRAVSVVDGENRFTYTMPPESVATFVWNRNLAEEWVRRAAYWIGEMARPAYRD